MRPLIVCDFARNDCDCVETIAAERWIDFFTITRLWLTGIQTIFYAIYSIKEGRLALISIVRILYFFDEDEIIIATNGFVKKQQKTPRSEILLAKQRRAIYMAGKEDIR